MKALLRAVWSLFTGRTKPREATFQALHEGTVLTQVRMPEHKRCPLQAMNEAIARHERDKAAVNDALSAKLSGHGIDNGRAN